jgi:hypothetical protein
MKIYSRPTKIFLAIINLIGFIATVAINALATILPINNKSTGELSDQYPNLFVPAGITFSIWGLIYILLAIFIVYQFVIAFKRTEDRGIFEKIGILFFLSCIFNSAWIFAWHYELVWLSLVIMVLLFITLLSIFIRLGIGKSQAPMSEKILTHINFSVYLGWITVATIANVTAFLVVINWNGFGITEALWTVIVMAVGAIIAILMVFTRNDIFFSLVVVWAYAGILIKRIQAPVAVQSVIITSIIALVLIGLSILIQLIRRKKIY